MTGEPVIPESVVYMGSTYTGCWNITGNITNLPDTLIYTYGTFMGCKNIGSHVELSKNIINARNCYRQTNNVKTAHIHQGGGDISHCFEDCANLTTVTADWTNRYEIIPFTRFDFITNMAYCFNGCRNLREVNMLLPQNGVNPLKDMYSCFSNCSNLRSVPIIPSTVENMSHCFYNCTNLTDIELWNGKMNASADGLIDYRFDNGVNTQYNLYLMDD